MQVSGLPADVMFATTSTVVTISADSQAATADFAGSYIRTSSIRGSITSGTGAGIVVTVSLTGVESRSGGSDTNGNFEFAGRRSGGYTVTISDFGTADFTLTSRDVSVAVGQSANVAFVGTVEEVTTSATVTISSITVTGRAGVTVVLAAVVGPIDVNLTIDEGTETITEAAVLLDGVVAGTQSFTTGASAEDGPDAAIRTATIQINTAAFAADGTPTHTNGPKVVSAQVTTTDGAGGTSTATAASSVNLTFANTNTFAATVEATNTAVGGNGLAYYGGSLTTTLVPVIYDGLTVEEVTTTFSNAGAGPVAVVTDLSGPSFGTFYSLFGYQTPAAALGTETITITAALYSDGTAFDPTGAILPLAVSGATGMSIDNVAPPAIAFVLTDQASGATSPICCSNNWVNDSYALGTDAFEAAAVDNVDGVGGVQVTYHMGLASESQASIAAGPAITTVGETGLSESALNDAYSPVAVITDALGNRRINGLAASADNPSTFTVGLDNGAPTMEDVTGVADETIYNLPAGATGATITFTATGDLSGLSAAPLRAEMTIDPVPAALDGPYVIALEEEGGGPVNTALTVAACGASVPAAQDAAVPNNCVPDGAAGPEDGYYTFTGHVIDQGGNPATTFTRKILQDLTAPLITANVAPSPVLTGGSPATFSSAV